MKKILLVAGVLFGLALPATAQQSPIRVNCGGSNYTDSKGQLWQADFGFDAGTTSTVKSQISGTQDSPLFQSARYSSSAALVYTFPVPNGYYHVNLSFAETTPSTEKFGARVFTVKLQGNPVLQNLDIFAAVGANAALVKGADVQIQNGTLQIEFDNVSQSAKINSIEILPTSTSSPLLTLNFAYPDGTAVSGTLSYTISSSLLSFQGSTPLTNGQATCYLMSSPASMGLSAQFEVNLNLTDTNGKVLWQLTVGLNPSQVSFGAVQSSTLNVVVQHI